MQTQKPLEKYVIQQQERSTVEENCGFADDTSQCDHPLSLMQQLA